MQHTYIHLSKDQSASAHLRAHNAQRNSVDKTVFLLGLSVQAPSAEPNSLITVGFDDARPNGHCESKNLATQRNLASKI